MDRRRRFSPLTLSLFLTLYFFLITGTGPIPRAVGAEADKSAASARDTASPAVAKPTHSTAGPSSPQATPASQPAPVPPRATEASSPLWRGFIWEALPATWLSDPKRANLLEMYEHLEWKPLFVNSRFESVAAASSLLNRIASAQEEAVDIRSYKLDEAREKLAVLEKSRKALAAAWPEYQDALADLGDAADPPAASEAPAASSGAAKTESPAQNLHRDPKIRELFKDCFKAASAFDVRMCDTLLRFGAELDAAAAKENLSKLAGSSSIPEFLSAVEPKSPHYRPLVKAYAHYKALAAKGQQQKIPSGPTIRPGTNDAVISSLQKRLQEEGYYSGKISGHFDAPTVEALKQYQTAHLLTPDGALGQQTRESLNVPFATKADLIAETLRLIRRDNDSARDRFIRINIPQFVLEYYRAGQLASVHRVIVGKASGKRIKAQGKWIGENQTPTLSSAIEQVVINPRWYVSDRIRLELDGEAKSDPAYFAKHGYVQLQSNYPWGQPRIFQRPGPGNPLGKVKFEFPNAYAVYLHDTPKKSLFQRSRRDFSHGCVRVERAAELALTILKDDNNPALDKVPTYLANDREAYLKLTTPVPIIMEYLPVTTDRDGRVMFPGDPYGWYSKDPDKKG